MAVRILRLRKPHKKDREDKNRLWVSVEKRKCLLLLKLKMY